MIVAACDGEPLHTANREAAVGYAEELVRRAPGARFRVSQDVAETALRGAVVERVADVLGCDAGGVSAASLLDREAQRFVGVAGVVASAGARFVSRSATVEEIVLGAVPDGFAWVAVESLLCPRALERDQVFAGRNLIVLPGDSELARVARGDRAMRPVASPRGVPAAWLGGGGEGSAPLSIALVSRRLGFEPA